MNVPGLWPLLAVNLACTMAMMSFVALVGPIVRILGLQPWHAGAAVTAAGLAWMLFARPWGGASDRHGRRPVLLLGAAGFALAFLALMAFLDRALSGAMPAWAAFAGMLLGRGVIGSFYAAIPATGQALIADRTPPVQRAGAMALLGAAGAVGMTMGPALAALLVPMGLYLPLYGSALLPFVGLAALWIGLPRDAALGREQQEPLRMTDARLRRPIALAFVAMLSVSVAQIGVGFLALDRLGLAPAEAARAAGFALATVGVALILSQLLVARLRWPLGRLVRVGGLVAALGFAFATLAVNIPLLCLCYFTAAAGMGWIFPAFAAMAANAVTPREQGAAAGVIGAVQGLGMMVGPVLGGALISIATVLPYAVVAVLLAVTALWPPRR
ncbi:MFS transporter [Roseococcus sp. YIM B11640]|uniref:MFS transporter n=1 Tax=Roseococcus sp. YIM B11640 TaxID=3133973 RepID=UPI003C7A6EAF